MGPGPLLASLDEPLLTSEWPGCGGIFKASPEDFEVEELPAYLPCGEGEHLFLWVEKVGRDTPEVARALARLAGIAERDVSYAGLKDRQAVTRQWFSLPARGNPDVCRLEQPGMRVLSHARHKNKLRTGHLKGNRFKIRLRDVKDAQIAREVLERLSQTGFANYFGAQRFGAKGDNAEWGRRLLRGEPLGHRVSRFERKLFFSAFQSWFFNRALATRMREGLFHQAVQGDVLKKLESGGVFVCEAPEVDQPRVDAFEISPAGPLFGADLFAARGEVAVFEQRLLAESGIRNEDLKSGRGELQGARRAYRLPFAVSDLVVSGSEVWLAFELPKGSYATVILRELTKDAVRPAVDACFTETTPS